MSKSVLTSIVAVSLAASILLANSTASAAENLALYDDFGTDTIRPEKWRYSTVKRKAQNGLLTLRHRMYGSQENNTGRQSAGVFLPFNNPGAITMMQATVMVKGAYTTGCSANPTVSMNAARLFGSYFNIGSPTVDSAVNDVVADIHIDQEAETSQRASGLHVIASVDLCKSANCEITESIAYHDLGTVDNAQSVKLTVKWEKESHRFVFQRDNTIFVSSPYLLDDSNPPSVKYKQLRVQNFPANCAVGPRTETAMTALFDDVMVNESAAQ